MERIERFLRQRAEQGLLRRLRPVDSRGAGRLCREGREFVDLSSNDYLGLSHHPNLKRVLTQATEEWGASSCASRLLSGDLSIHHALEERIASISGKTRALMFSSGYQANVGIISALVGGATRSLPTGCLTRVSLTGSGFPGRDVSGFVTMIWITWRRCLGNMAIRSRRGWW